MLFSFKIAVANKRITGATYIAELGDCECTQQNYYGVLCHEFAHCKTEE